MTSLEAQLATAARIGSTVAGTRDRLRLLNARLDEAVAATVELSASAAGVDSCTARATTSIGLVDEMEALRRHWRRPTPPAHPDDGSRRRSWPGHSRPRVRGPRCPSLEPARPLDRVVWPGSTIVATGTLASRVTGLIRVIFFAAALGRRRWPTPTTWPTTPRTSSTSCSSAACCRPRWSRCSPPSSDDDEEATDVVVTATMSCSPSLDGARRRWRAPLIFRLYTLDPSLVGRRRQSAASAPLLRRIFLLQIFFYGLTALADASSTPAAASSPPAWSPVLNNVVVIAMLLVAARSPAANGADAASTSLDDRHPALDRSASARPPASRRWRSSLIPARRAGPACAAARTCELRHPAVSGCALSGWTLGYVIANQVAIVFIRNLADPAPVTSPRTSGLHVLRRCPTACWRCRSPRRSSRRWPAR